MRWVNGVGMAESVALPVHRPLSIAPPDGVWVTRPAQAAASWVQALQVAGWPAQALPLIGLSEPRDAGQRQALMQARAQWLAVDVVMFVSTAAVQYFFAQGVQAPPCGQAVSTRFWAPGPGTASALTHELALRGLGPQHVYAPAPQAAQFDSEALWAVVAPQIRAGHRVLMVRGATLDASSAEADGLSEQRCSGDGRDWLMQQCVAAGAQVHTCAAYERSAPVLTPAWQAQLQQACAQRSVWLLSSSQAVGHLVRLAAEVGCTLGRGSALVTHPRIGQVASAAGFARVVQTRPTLPEVLHALQSNWSF